MLRAPPLTLNNAAATVEADVQADLNAATVSADGTITYQPGDEALVGSEPALRFSLDGPLGAAGRVFDSEPLAQFLTQRALETEQARVEAHAGGAAGETAAAPRGSLLRGAAGASMTRALEVLRQQEEEARQKAEAEAEAQKKAEQEARLKTGGRGAQAEEDARLKAEERRREAEARAETSRRANGETAVDAPAAVCRAACRSRGSEELPKLNLDDGFMQMLNGNQ